MDAQQSLSEGDLEETLIQLQASVRSDPSNVKHRVFLFQLLSVMGQWERALTQLDVIGEMDASTLAMVQTYRPALHCENLRADIFAGKRSPMVFGKPEQWMALLFDALRLSAQGQYAQSQDARNQAFELAPTTSGTIENRNNDEGASQAFNWIADADPRMGPMLEAIINGNYYWVPFHRIRAINIEAPEDMRDMAWMPVYFTWANGGETVGLIPTRYAGSESSDDNQVRTAHKTIWQEQDVDVYQGLGQRMFSTDTGEYSLMDLRLISLNSQEEEIESSETHSTTDVL